MEELNGAAAASPETLTPVQAQAAAAAGSGFLLGPAGTGKTTTLRRRLVSWLAAGASSYTILILVAEGDHAQGFQAAVREAGLGPFSDLEILTYQQLARNMVTLFWPLLARPAGFARAHQPPTFLSYDLAQLLLWETVRPLQEEGAFADVRLRPQQIVSQILDTLNRAALNGLSLDEAVARQKASWAGDANHLRALENAATAARRFRQVCLDGNLLDLSLTVRVFSQHLVEHAEFQRYFSERYLHLLVDNVEEQTPAGQHFIATLMDATSSTAIAYDAGGGYRRFLAADPTGANQFRQHCDQTWLFERSFTADQPLLHLGNLVENFLVQAGKPAAEAGQAIVQRIDGRYRHELVSELVAYLAALVQEVPPAEVAVVAPYLDGALRHNLTTSLAQAGIPHALVQRRFTPRDEPRVRAWLTWLLLAHPDWGMTPPAYDVAEALSLSVASLDPVRAHLLVRHLYQSAGPSLQPVAALSPELVSRIGPERVALVEELRLWLEEATGRRLPLDRFLHRLFHQLLAQRAFQPEPDLAGAAVCDWLVRAAGRLRRAAEAMGLTGPAAIGRAFVEGIYQGLVTGDPPQLGQPPDPSGVVVATVHGFLLSNRVVDYQVWLQPAATGWWDIPRQPLSNAFVLAQSWPSERQWTMDEEFKMRNQLLSRLVRGLAHRCRRGVILANSDLDRRGLRHDGPLWRALQPLLRAR
ncbi:MAG: hypothetical protein R3300_01520 [Candidatus Promineifilaceae bacterium]|nr:hypothetical protein [Candidatus Promineifilaceae bacterium]